MTSKAYTIEVDTARKLITITCAGLWEIATVDDAKKDMQAEINRLHTRGVGRNDLLVLIDRRQQGVQTQTVVAALQQIAGANTAKALRTAVLLTGALSRLQADRIGNGFGIFAEQSDAMHWLLTGIRRDNPA